jgi:hypothetical protein
MFEDSGKISKKKNPGNSIGEKSQIVFFYFQFSFHFYRMNEKKGK